MPHARYNRLIVPGGRVHAERKFRIYIVTPLVPPHPQEDRVIIICNNTARVDTAIDIVRQKFRRKCRNGEPRRTFPHVTTIFDKGLFQPMKIGFSRVVLRAPRTAIYARVIQGAAMYPENIWFLAQLVCSRKIRRCDIYNRDVILFACVFDREPTFSPFVYVFYTIFTQFSHFTRPKSLSIQ